MNPVTKPTATEDEKRAFKARRAALIKSYMEDSGMSRKEATANADFDLGARSWVVTKP